MKSRNFVSIDKWYAWRPVKTTDEGWVWFKKVTRTIDTRPEDYLGLLPIYSYTLDGARDVAVGEFFRIGKDLYEVKRNIAWCAGCHWDSMENGKCYEGEIGELLPSCNQKIFVKVNEE